MTQTPVTTNAYAADVFAFVDAVQHARSVGELNDRFRRLVERWGFENWFAVEISRRPEQIVYPLQRRFGHYIDAWRERYVEAKHIHHDKAAHAVVGSSEPFWWSDFRTDRPLNARAHQVFEEAGEFGMKNGLVVPVRFPDGSVWSCCMTGEAPAKSPEVTSAATVAALFYAGRGGYLRAMAPPPPPRLACRLTPRQAQIVEALRYGKTQTEIAQILGLSQSTVFNELAEARKRLGVATAAELVAEALLHGEIPGLSAGEP